MKVKMLVAAALLCPAAALAQSKAPQANRDQIYQRCVPACQANKSELECTRICACAADEVGARWTAEQIAAYADRLKAADAGPERENLKRIAAQCARMANR